MREAQYVSYLNISQNLTLLCRTAFKTMEKDHKIPKSGFVKVAVDVGVSEKRANELFEAVFRYVPKDFKTYFDSILVNDVDRLTYF